MKLSKKTKGILALSSAVILTLPALTLTGCSNISQYCIPVLTGTNPFTVTNVKDPYRESPTYGIYSTDTAGGTTSTTEGDYAITDSKMQLPSSYIYTSAYDGNFYQETTNIYGFTNYNTPEWKTDAPNESLTNLKDKYQFSRKDDNDNSWRSPKTSTQLAYTISDGRLSSYQNLNICSAITTVNTTTSSFVNTFNYMNNYLNRIVSQRNEADILQYLNYLFSGNKSSGFDYGTGDGKNNFYQYCLDNANLLSTAGSQYKFGPYIGNWSFNNSGIVDGDGVFATNSLEAGLGEATNPFLNVYMKDLRQGQYGFASPITTIPKDSKSQFEFPTNIAFTGSYLVDNNDPTKEKPLSFKYIPAISGSSTLLNPYVKYTYKEPAANADKEIDDFAGIMSIPMLISPKDVQSAYYNPSSNNSSIQPADWLTANGEKDNINNKLNQEGSWSVVKQNVNLPDLGVTTLTYDQKASTNLTNITSPQTGNNNSYFSWMSEGMKTKYTANPAQIDPRVKNWIDNGKIKFGDWVALANYGTLTISFKYEYSETEGGEVKHQYIKALLPFFSGFSAIFPAYMLLTNDDCYEQINKDAKDNAPEKNAYYIKYSGSGIEKDFNNMMKALTDTALPNLEKTYTSTYDMMKNDPYMIYAWTFGKLAANGASGTTITDAKTYFDFFTNHDTVVYTDILKDAA